MRVSIYIICCIVFSACGKQQTAENQHGFNKVTIQALSTDTISIRSLTKINDSIIGFGYDKGYGLINLITATKTLFPVDNSEFISLDTQPRTAEQRATAFNGVYFFSLGVGSPTVLRKHDSKTGQNFVVYVEKHEATFYDAMAFWNKDEGIAIGDPTNACLSIIITRDGGEQWEKISCERLPKIIKGEAAFAASNSNIVLHGDNAWIVSGGMVSRVYHSADKGHSWSVVRTPMIGGTPTTGAYAMDFYDSQNGFIVGGDYTNPTANRANKAITNDAGNSWSLVADSEGPGYKSCVRYVPNSLAKEIVALGVTGISYSNDQGVSWKELSKESFYTMIFINDSIAIAAGKNKIAKLYFD
ncbi:WD40/YVTN/BNR-like repeat-containing protein [Aquimarina sp. W85]|uniref:WD40/YVTN/BNR-like repeat-containing protein n=1 Tax=Aquimarina rhodophyticola TaxID=3342246 RepID=UPI00366F58CA